MVSPTDDIAVLIARGRLSNARKWFEHLGWPVLPQGIRGQRILAWAADQAWLASPANPKRSVRRWCRRWAPWLKDAELRKIIAASDGSNKRWSGDQCATVLEISMRDRTALCLRFIGVDDDPNYERRDAMKREKAACRARRYRAAHRTGKTRGRPVLELSPEDRLARKRAQTAERVALHRVTLKCVTPHKIDIGSVTELSVTGKSAKPNARPWEAAGISRRTYYRRKSRQRDEFSVTDLSHVPAVTDLDCLDFAKFGITAIRVMRGTDVLRAWVLS
jgi:hypothetical protein